MMRLYHCSTCGSVIAMDLENMHKHGVEARACPVCEAEGPGCYLSLNIKDLMEGDEE